jgi:hypothetical protein
MGSVSKNIDCQKQSCVIMLYWLYTQKVSMMKPMISSPIAIMALKALRDATTGMKPGGKTSEARNL